AELSEEDEKSQQGSQERSDEGSRQESQEPAANGDGDSGTGTPKGPGNASSAGKKPSLGKTFGIVAVLTVLSKCAGLIRDIVVLQAFGTNYLSDAFNNATLFTGNILILFGGLGGPFHSSSVAVLTPKKDDPDSGRMMVQIFVATMIFLIVPSVLIYYFAPDLIQIIAPSSALAAEHRQEYWDETVRQIRIMLPLVAISGFVGLSYGVLNVYNKIFWPSFSPAIASLAIIIAVFCFGDSAGIVCLAWATLAGAIGQAVVQIPGMLKTPLKWSFSTRPHPGLREYLLMLGPAAFSTSIGQISLYVHLYFTSTIQEGGWTAIVNANRLIQLPLGVLLTAMLVPILPRFTEQVAANRIDDLKNELSKALRLLWFLALPIAALLMAIPAPIIRLLFERGKFTTHSTDMVTTVMIFLAPGIFFYLARDLITRVFYAHQDSKTPFLIAIAAIVLQTFLDWLFVSQMKTGIAGIAIATTLVTVFNLFALTFFARKKIGRLGTTKLVYPTAIMLLASTACGALAWFVSAQATQYIPQNFIGQVISLSLSCGLGLVAYLIICVVCKLEEPSSVTNRLLKRRQKTS
ncbi:MAG: murein biosynthesis integral membrane protein MurJ, partial [Candidatus Obscuribacterales bacterium]|nr:murein biosynthesis integral membrane protein MurJ [Candidatus Obscuribacterales bacterium]